MSESIVQKKIASMLQRELGEILQRGGYVQGVMPSVSVVRITPDLSQAKVFVTVFPDAKLQETVDIFNERDWEIRKQLGARIRNKVKHIPEVRFFVDDSFIEAEKIDELLNNLDMGGEEKES